MSPRDRLSFLIVEPDHLIADDLRETLLGFDPEAGVRMARDASGAEALLEGVGALTAGFLRLPSRELRWGALPRAVERRGGRVVVLDAPGASAGEHARGGLAGGFAEGPPAPLAPVSEHAGGWIYTGRPYGARTITHVLVRMGLTPR